MTTTVPFFITALVERHPVIKYLHDDNAEMGRSYFFISPEFGILILRSAWWGDHEKLTRTGDGRHDRVIYYLDEMIENNDKDFFMERPGAFSNPSTPNRHP